MAHRGSALASSDSKPPQKSCCSRLIWEIREVSFFGLEEPNSETLDAQASFAPAGRVPIGLRTVFFLWSAATLVANLYIYPEENLFIFLGYLTHWTWVIALLYQSVALSLVTCVRKYAMQPEKGEKAGFWIRFMWILYSIAAPAQLVVVILYWALEYNPGDDIGYFNVMKHGFVALMIFLDGLVMVCIPIRVKHLVFVMLYSAAYTLWSYLHSYFEIGNGSFEDDVLYDVLDWRDSPGFALTLSLLVVFLFGPLCYLTVYGLSLVSGWKCDGSRRRYVSQQKDQRGGRMYVSMA